MKKRFPPKSILVPVDLSKPTQAALSAATYLAKRFRAALELLSVEAIPESLLGLTPDGEPYSRADLAKQMREFHLWREERLRRQAKSLDGIPWRLKTVAGSPPTVIAARAGRPSSGLVVMGTHGYEGVDRLLFGSVAEAVVKGARVPVLAIHPGKKPFRVRKVLIPCNMADYADMALHYALDFAKALGAKAEVLYVAAEGEWPLDSEALLRRHLGMTLGRRAARLATRVRRGDPRDEIIAEARRGGFDLIALSAHRRPFLSGFVLGSTAERVLRHSPVPVLCVPMAAPSRRLAPAAEVFKPTTKM